MSQPYDRVFNFSAGPCTLPVEVLEEARDNLMNWKGHGLSVMEMSHRSKVYIDIQEEAEADLRDVFRVPENFEIIFAQGGASLQNTMIPMSFLGAGQTADYVVTGTWGKKSEEAAHFVGKVNLAYSGKDNNYSQAPDLTSLEYSPNSAYIHWTSNETIQGVEFKTDPKLPAPSVCDMSSNILSRPVDFSKYDLIYAGAQKNQGPAGVTIVILSQEMLEKTPAATHPMLDYRQYVSGDNMPNTPPCWSIYMCGLVYKWVRKEGGLEEMFRRNSEKAGIIYQAIDSSGGFYTGHAAKDCRSIMNVTFRLPSEELTNQFVKEAKAYKLDGLAGHRSVGGIRASIYNAFPKEGCETLASFMKDFACQNG
ncbi:MAG TPA: 3-phosphoserine/phosphohydroxythreonine transaminase [Fimbriimonadaceae bacterium]|nr:3-phosphoserine/phosphohydroxythreonine transaminase [Fimbriimonadaceae bacterium]